MTIRLALMFFSSIKSRDSEFSSGEVFCSFPAEHVLLFSFPKEFLHHQQAAYQLYNTTDFPSVLGAELLTDRY